MSVDPRSELKPPFVAYGLTTRPLHHCHLLPLTSLIIVTLIIVYSDISAIGVNTLAVTNGCANISFAGYVRVVLTLLSCYYMPHDHVTASFCYIIGSALDAADGYAARVFKQGETPTRHT